MLYFLNGHPLVCRCCICQLDFEGEDEVTVLPACSHLYHSDCVSQWLGINKVKSRGMQPLCYRRHVKGFKHILLPAALQVCPVCNTEVQAQAHAAAEP
jgi:hypothetical protein